MDKFKFTKDERNQLIWDMGNFTSIQKQIDAVESLISARFEQLQSELSKANKRIEEIKKVYYLINNGNLNQEGLTLYHSVGNVLKLN